MACANKDSTESKKGSPNPIGSPFTTHSTMPPTLSCCAIALSIPFSTEFSPPTSIRVAVISMEPTSCFATTPAATKHAVNLPLKCPPPL